MRNRRPSGLRRFLLAGLLLTSGCAPGTALVCTAGPPRTLPAEIEETSGAAWSSRNRDVFWTHNDGRSGVLYAVDTTGALVARVETDGPRLWDVEDLAGGACEEGYCLYMADTGDNQERRDVVFVDRLPEPSFEATSAPRTRFPMRFPDGPRDVESLIVLPGERLFLVSKGRSEAVTFYRYPGDLDADRVVQVEPFGTLGSGPPGFSSRVSGGSSVPGHEDLVLIRSYERLILLRITEAGFVPVPDGELNLVPLQEPQGEAVAAHADGRVVVTTEAGPLSPNPGMHLLRCAYPAVER